MARSINSFRDFDNSPEVIRTVVMMCVKYPLSLRNVEDLLAERDIDICHETGQAPTLVRLAQRVAAKRSAMTVRSAMAATLNTSG